MYRTSIRGIEPGYTNASNLFLVHQKIENSKMLRMKFWTSDVDLKKWSKRPRDPHNGIRLEKLCPKVISDPQNAGGMPSKRRFLHFRPIMENLGLNVNFHPQPNHFKVNKGGTQVALSAWTLSAGL